MNKSPVDSDPVPEPPKHGDLVGQTISSYRITRKLGEGGFGAVYLGQHPQIESKVAIKVLQPQFVTDANMVERFLDEARAVNRIGHRGVVRIHDTGQLPTVGVYLVMEYLEGESLLERYQRRGPLPVEEAVRFAMQACTALGACHRAGIVHRDLKPANMFVVADVDLPGGERVIILDFGIAKLAQQPELGRATATGTLLGSPLYMSPEQCLDSKHVDHRSDIFSLGVVAYELLTGRCPYQADTLGQLVLKHSDEEPPSLSSLRADLPGPLEAVVDRALERRPEDRYQGMDQLRRALEKAFFGTETSPKTIAELPSRLDLDAIGEAETIAPDSSEQAPRLSGLEEAAESTEAAVRAVGGGPGAGIMAAALAAVVLLGGVLYLGLSGPKPPARTKKVNPPPVHFIRPPVAKKRQAVIKQAVTKQAVIKQVVITLDLTPSSAVVVLDGQPVKGRNLSLPVGPQKHDLKVSAAGYVTVHRPLVVEGPRTVRVALKRGRSGGHPSTTRVKSKTGGRVSGKKPGPAKKPTKKEPRKKQLYFKKL